jgi:putative PIN family toxin of toxin-antitoxin system
MFKVVIDTNLLINAAKDEYNYANRIIDEVLAGKILAYANPATFAENCLMAEKKVRDPEYKDKLNHYFEKVRITEAPVERLAVVEDNDDNKLVESAVVAKAGYVISSDQHLTKLEHYDGIRILSPQQFWTVYEEESGASWQDWIKQFIK